MNINIPILRNINNIRILNYLSPLFKSLLTVAIISYFLMCLVYFSHVGPIGEDIFKQKFSYQELSNTSFIIIQEEIISHYIKWINSAMHLDFGQAYSYPPTSVLSLVSSKIYLSSKLILFSLLIALALSIIIVIVRKYKLINEILIEPLLSISFAHILVTIMIYKTIFDITIGSSIFTASLILCLGSGFLSDFSYLLYKEYENIMSKDYAIFAEFSGFSKLLFTLKEMTISLISISTSRIPILFGGMIILEIASGGTLEGVGYLIWDSGFVNQNLRVFYSATVFSIFVTSFFFFLADFIDRKILLKN